MSEGGKYFELGSSERAIEEEKNLENIEETKEEREAREKRELALEVLKLISHLIEGGIEWDAQKRQNVRMKIQNGLAALKVKSIMDEGFQNILYPSQNFAPTVPQDYPAFEEFKTKFQEILKMENHQSNTQWDQPPNLVEFMKHVYVEDWKQVEGRHFLETEQYLYQLGKVLCDRKTYKATFPKQDNIRVRSNGWLQNGRHRTLILKCLGEDFINNHGFQVYITIELEE